MTDEQIDKLLHTASGSTPQVNPALLKGIADSLNASLRMVRPLPPTWLLAGALALVCITVAVAAAAGLGFHGIGRLSLWDFLCIQSALAILIFLAGSEFVHRMVPGSRRRVSAKGLLTISCAVLLGMFAVVFHDYRTEHFFAAGVVCVLAGLLVAVPAGALCWLLIRNGFAVNPLAAGLIGGTLAGLCGVMMLELHCPDFQALHILVWHTVVVPVSAAVGALIGYAVLGRSRRS